jgi:hypothetical protein
MTNEDIVGGLRSALARGESLRQAMMTFYNAGYAKADIEWAARSLQMREDSYLRKIDSISKKILPKKIYNQKVSKYEKKPAIPGGRIGIMMLIILLSILLLSIISIIFFKDSLIKFFDSFF